MTRVLGATSLGGDRFVSRDGRSTFVVISLGYGPRDKRDELAALERLTPPLTVTLPDGGKLAPRLGGLVPAGRALTQVAESSLVRGERIALPRRRSCSSSSSAAPWRPRCRWRSAAWPSC